MKLILFIFGIFVAVNGSPTSPSPLNEDELISLGKSLRKEVEDLKQRVIRIQDNSQKVVKDKLLKIQDVQVLQAGLNEALKTTSITADCAAKMDQNFRKIATEVNQELLQNAVKNITGDEKFLEQNKQELMEIENVLTLSLDKEVASCLADIEKCRLTREFIDKTDKLFQLVDEQQIAIVDFVKNSADYFESKDLLDKIQRELVAPSLPCLQ